MGESVEDPLVQPKAASFFVDESDVTGRLALVEFLLSSKDRSIHAAIEAEIANSSTKDVEIFRSFAKQQLDAHIGRVVDHKSLLVRDAVQQGAYRDIMMSNYETLLSGQEVGFQKIISSVENSSGAFRQIVISVAASFVFGVGLALAPHIEPPFKIPFLQHEVAPPVGASTLK